jgi:hypothetical protein
MDDVTRTMRRLSLKDVPRGYIVVLIPDDVETWIFSSEHVATP